MGRHQQRKRHPLDLSADQLIAAQFQSFLKHPALKPTAEFRVTHCYTLLGYGNAIELWR